MTRVLIADDNAIFREVIKRHVVALFGFETVEAADGAAAVALAEAGRPDLILLDLMMPGMDGIEAIRRIRALPAMRDVPIVFLSAETDRRKWAEALSAGANDFISKPYHRQELEARLSLHLKLASLGRELRSQNALFSRERYLAGCVQRQLLPKDLDFPGFESAAVYQAQEQVGGDFYEAWDDGRAVYILMADISGHGASAAMLMAVCKGLLLSLREDRLSPEEIVGRLNRFLCTLLDGGDLDMFVTLVLARIDRAAPILSVVSAGHVPSFILGPRGLADIAPHGPALGIIADYAWTAETVPFGRGDMLFLYTDGLTELRSPDKVFFGDERLRLLLRPDRSPKDLIGEIIETALPFCKGTLHDDLAMAALRRL
ncbi:response regulator receiver modulated serine phosphatase [Solidesulfovibrio carbinoliphilus subsp. oakridgensis]|uniref:Response regulator receiver modulated serine phosphatase n=1 Tax=Solidesulfovibrio carbinoliphilus subsp. oakridgensis TaxID=694327 RepID=G7Q8J4_9BACT|nr:fused response regulator/phosphatase [Solidesulfovibrio carbinoliphilus]EHJ49081.1 response regulator receiver modulated serine phosphatase [Solidesulfovibrio carbinoliphilus subsp. oakridgensis]